MEWIDRSGRPVIDLTSVSSLHNPGAALIAKHVPRFPLAPTSVQDHERGVFSKANSATVGSSPAESDSAFLSRSGPERANTDRDAAISQNDGRMGGAASTPSPHVGYG